MGSELTTLNQNAIQNSGLILDLPIQDQLDEIKQQNHEVFGLIKISKSKNEQQLKFLSKIFPQSKYNHLNDYQYIIQRDHPQLIKFYGFQITESYGFREKVTDYVLYYEYQSKNLKDILNHHIQNNSLLREDKVWKIIDEIVSVCSYLQQQDKAHGDIQPSNIFFDQDLSVKIIVNQFIYYFNSKEYQAFPLLKTGYEKVINNEGKAYLSPSQMKEIRIKLQNTKVNQVRSDVFAFGMTLLEILTLEDSFKLYDFDKCAIKSYEDQIKKVEENNYSEKLVILTRILLSKNRPRFIQVQEFIRDLKQNKNDYLIQKIIRGEKNKNKVTESQSLKIPREGKNLIVNFPQINVSPGKLENSVLRPKTIVIHGKTQSQDYLNESEFQYQSLVNSQINNQMDKQFNPFIKMRQSKNSLKISKMN